MYGRVPQTVAWIPFLPSDRDHNVDERQMSTFCSVDQVIQPCVMEACIDEQEAAEGSCDDAREQLMLRLETWLHILYSINEFQFLYRRHAQFALVRIGRWVWLGRNHNRRFNVTNRLGFWHKAMGLK